MVLIQVPPRRKLGPQLNTSSTASPCGLGCLTSVFIKVLLCDGRYGVNKAVQTIVSTFYEFSLTWEMAPQKSRKTKEPQEGA